MAFNTKSIVKDVNQKPVPQYYNPTADIYEVLEGANGANKVMLYNADGAAIDLASLIATIVTAINTTGTTQLRAGSNVIGKVDINSNDKELYCKSNEAKPSAAGKLGYTLFEIDVTGNKNNKVYMSDGTEWRPL